ncbi:MAG: ribosome silencing factor [Chitinispirillaceae bacterium]|nr:ribosome silencing factor [Chitinispirillaceae bacterium]
MNFVSRTLLRGKTLVDTVVAAAQNKLAENIAIIDLSGRDTPADYFVICQSDNVVQNRAIADEIIARCGDQYTRPWHHEGTEEGRWIVIDFTDVVVHVLLPDLRRFYDLESLWSEGRRCAMPQ